MSTYLLMEPKASLFLIGTVSIVIYPVYRIVHSTQLRYISLPLPYNMYTPHTTRQFLYCYNERRHGNEPAGQDTREDGRE